MRKLVRGAMPLVLANKLRQKRQTPLLGWGDVTPQEKAEIWIALEQMQGGCCAYCERRLEGGKKQHIEHFLKQAGHDERVFDWHNLFGSCVDLGSCGKHKDERAKNWAGDDLIKPDVDEPDEFLQFFSDGSVRERQGLTAQRQHRARETLRVFNLDQHSALREMRKNAVSGWLSSLEVVRAEWWRLLEQGQCTEEYALACVAEAVQELLAKTADLPFATAIRHTLTWQGG
jgi:uncharacterized protein (TIGR02646 family)